MADDAVIEIEEKPVIKYEKEDDVGNETVEPTTYQPEGQFMPYNVNMDHWLMEKLYRQNEMYLRSLSAAAAAVASATMSSPATSESSSPPCTSNPVTSHSPPNDSISNVDSKKSPEEGRLNSSILQILNSAPQTHSSSPHALDSHVLNNVSSEKRRKELSLKQKVDMIQSSNGKSQRQLADEFNVCKSQVHNIMKRKDEILETFEYSTPSNRKRRFIRTENEEINLLTLQYYMKMKELDVNVTGSMLQRKAREVAQQLGKTEFKASNGWLESFRKRHKIGSCYSGESATEKLPSFPSFAKTIKMQGSTLELPQNMPESIPGSDQPLSNVTDEQQIGYQSHLHNGFHLPHLVHVG